MRRTITIAYTLVTATLAVATTMYQMPPALLFIELFTTQGGDSFSLTLVLLLTWLVLLLPLIAYLAVAKLQRIPGDDPIPSDRTGVVITRKKSFQSAMVGFPVFINGKESGLLDNGRTKFYELPSGVNSIHIGYGRQASQPMIVNCQEGQQVRLEMELEQGLFAINIRLRMA